MDRRKKLPVGIDNFCKIRRDGYYYVDKTALIEQLFADLGEVNLFTRPRRFGKTLNMSMLKSFFEIGGDAALFEGLHVAENKALCALHMGQYPVIFISLKGAEGLSFPEARKRLIRLIRDEAERFLFLESSAALQEPEQRKYRRLLEMTDREEDYDTVMASLKTMSVLLHKHYQKKTVILLDEYDVPLDKAFQNGYYREMVSMMRGILGDALKTNDSLAFGVLTGCLRVSKESIFTGLNNFKILSITDTRFDEQFGFTDAEVRRLLSDYQMEDHFAEAKEWYDGYHFGNADVYCPWDVINHVDRLKADPQAKPEAYWINTSGNDLVKRFVDKAGKTTRDEIERLIAGEVIEKPLRLDLTYDEVDSSIENLWSVLFTTGYLTQLGRTEGGAYHLVIPNREVKEVFRLQIQEWFRKSIFSNTEALQQFWDGFAVGDAAAVEKYLNRVLSNSVSVFDAKGRNEEREASYHNLLLGILSGNGSWLVRSNVEAGEGFADIIVELEDPDAGIVAELKYAGEYSGMEAACGRALAQIRDKRYPEYLLNADRRDILLYGIAFCKKRCRVMAEKLQ